MKNITTALLLLLFPFILYGQNDCTDAIVVCGNNNYNSLNATGMGIQELNINNACSGVENNSLWLKVPIKQGGSLGFIITPDQATDLEVDFDFWVFGPTADCSNLGTAIRCSTTNPIAAGLTYNTTGVRQSTAGNSEGPGEDGDGYVSIINANDNDVYYLVIDRPIGTSNFSLTWTGTAKFYDVPVSYSTDVVLPDIAQCDADGTDDNTTAFDLTVHENVLSGPQTDIAFTYHLTVNDMITGENAIATPQAYNNTSNPQPIYLRMTNTVTGCFTEERIRIQLVDAVFTGTPVNLTLCDEDNSGLRLFDLWENNTPLSQGDANVNVRYYTTQDDANLEANALGRFYQNSQPFTPETIYARLENFTGCFGYSVLPFTLTVPPIADFSYTLDVTDLTGTNNNTVSINMDSGNNAFEFSTDGITFIDIATFYQLAPGMHTFYIRDKNLCNTIDIDVPILSYPRFFTPNGDSYNEIWSIDFIRYYPDAYITIFDRYGNLIYGFFGREMGWDGTYNGTPIPANDYWFTIAFASGREVKGHFSLIR